ncbi:hypothetical protein QQP08_016649 [Theobroma cacao]|nr:hypothetical protein QQP08_016649 [Theobroma cacao]
MEQTHQHLRVKLYKNPSALHEFSASEKSVVAINFSLVTTMAINGTSVRTSSDGVWQGENPLNYAFPLLILQTTIVLFTSRFLAVLLKPLRQPKVVAEIVVRWNSARSFCFGPQQRFLAPCFPCMEHTNTGIGS